MEADAADVRGTGLRAGLHDLLNLGRVVVDARHQGRDQDATRDAHPRELRDRLDPRPRVRRVRLRLPPGLLVDRRDREVRRERGDGSDLLEQIEIAKEQR